MTNDPTSAAYEALRTALNALRLEVPKSIMDDVQRIVEIALAEAETRGRIDSYQRIMLWLEEQEDNDKLALLSKDISVELDSLFSQLQANVDGANGRDGEEI